MAKKIPKKKTKKKIKSKEYKKKAMSIKRKRQVINLALGALLVLIVVSSVIILLANRTDIAFFDRFSDMMPEKEQYAAVVNEEPVTLTELNERYAQIPAQYQPYISKQDMLEQIIDEKLLLEEADELGITVSDDEVESYMLNLTAEAGSTMEEFEQVLIQNGLTLEDAKTVYKRSLLLNKVAESQIFTDIEVTPTDIEDYYNSNPELFTSPLSINVSHILICHVDSERCESNLTQDEALEIAEDVYGMAEEGNFGELALEYSDEPAAQLTQGNLGWVNAQMQFDQTFLNAALELDAGEISEPVETIFGYHIIKVFDKRPEQVVGLETVYANINQTINAERQSAAYTDYMQQKRNESNIVYFDLE